MRTQHVRRSADFDGADFASVGRNLGLTISPETFWNTKLNTFEIPCIAERIESRANCSRLVADSVLIGDPSVWFRIWQRFAASRLELV